MLPPARAVLKAAEGGDRRVQTEEEDDCALVTFLTHALCKRLAGKVHGVDVPLVGKGTHEFMQDSVHGQSYIIVRLCSQIYENRTEYIT